MSAFENQVAEALRDPLARARAHAARGRKVIGFVGAEIPVELIIASGAYPVRLASAADASTDLADRYLESTFMPDVRSIAQQYLQGALNFMHAIVLPRSNDSAQRLYYYLSDLRTRQFPAAPVPLVFDLAKIPRDSSKLHSRLAVERLAAEIGTASSALPGAIRQRNRRRKLFLEAMRMRPSHGGIRGSVMDRIFRSADFCDADEFDGDFGAWLTKADVAVKNGRRLLLVGSSPPDERLHRAVEEGGGNVVSEGDAHASRSVSSPLIPEGESLDAIADHYHALRGGTRAFIDRAAAITDLAESVAASGVIIWLIEEEDALIWDLPAEMAALKASGTAALRLVRRRWDLSDDALAEIKSFTRGLEEMT
jgi:benzoyl-CoA reductase/2-hydroxyglutaryl-CoA dehydratase subunit BcrC/BadD/HgdB